MPDFSTNSARRVVVFGLGGTIAMTSTSGGGVVPALSADQLVAAVPVTRDALIFTHALYTLPDLVRSART